MGILQSVIKTALDKLALEHWSKLCEVFTDCGFELIDFSPWMVQLETTEEGPRARIYMPLKDPNQHLVEKRSVFDPRHAGQQNTIRFDKVMLEIREAAINYVPDLLVGSCILSGNDTLILRSFGKEPTPITNPDFESFVQDLDAFINPQGIYREEGIVDDVLHLIYSAPTSTQPQLLAYDDITRWVRDQYKRIPKGGFLNNLQSVSTIKIVIQRINTVTGRTDPNVVILPILIRDVLAQDTLFFTNLRKKVLELGDRLIMEKGASLLKERPVILDSIIWFSNNRTLSDDVRYSALQLNCEDFLIGLKPEGITEDMRLKWFAENRGRVLHQALVESTKRWERNTREAMRVRRRDAGLIGVFQFDLFIEELAEMNRPRHVLLEMTIKATRLICDAWEKSSDPLRDNELRKLIASRLATLLNYTASTKHTF